MNAIITQYDLATGKPTMWASVPVSMLDIQQDNIVYGHVDPATEYVEDRTIVPRPENPATLTGSTLSNVPVPAIVAIDGVQYDTDEATIDLDLQGLGDFTIVVRAWPHKDAVFKVTI